MTMVTQISAKLGFDCYALTDDGNIAEIAAPYVYPDGDDVAVYIEQQGNQIRLFDYGDAALRLLTCGMFPDDERTISFINQIAGPNGLTLNKDGELEIWISLETAPTCFAQYLKTMLALEDWESVLPNGIEPISKRIEAQSRQSA